MGAQSFEARAKGASVEEAFRAAVSHAQHMVGHGGYSGSIAEKDGWTLMFSEAVSLRRAGEIIGRIYDTETCVYDEESDRYLDVQGEWADLARRVNGKWGPAGAIPIAEADGGGWLFFGWASA